MNIILVGLSHKTAPLELREQLAFSEDHVMDALNQLIDQDTVDESLIVSTCNRVELIASAPGGPERGLGRLTRFLSDYHRMPIERLNQHLYRHSDSEAVTHMFRVASSLDSMVIGESQILGQVKDAYEQAVNAGTVGRVLSQLMHKAISVAKRVRTETGVSQNAVSISSVAVELAERVFGDLKDKTVLLVGAGEMGELAAQALLDAGTMKLIVTNRSADRAESVAARFGGGAVNFEAFYEVLPSADIIICSTGAPDYVISAPETRKALKSRRKGPTLLIDISVPRNIDPALSELENCFLFDVDDLDSVVQSNLKEREREARIAESIVEAEVQNFIKHLRALDIGPSVVEVKELLFQMAHSEFRRHRKRMGTLTEDQENTIRDVLIPALVNKLSHPMIIHLRSAARNGDSTDVLEELRKMVKLD